MTVATADQALYQIVSGAAPITIDDVLQTMQSIDQLLPGTDGLKWFNRLYMMVTQQVDQKPLQTDGVIRPGLRASTLSSPASTSGRLPDTSTIRRPRPVPGMRCWRRGIERELIAFSSRWRA